MTSIVTEVELRGRTFEVIVEGVVTSGGSNSYGSDEPEWTDVEDVEIYRGDNGKPVSVRLHNALLAEYDDKFCQMLMEESKW